MALYAHCAVSGRTEKYLKTALCAIHAEFAVHLHPPLGYVPQAQRQIQWRVSAEQGISGTGSRVSVAPALDKPSWRITGSCQMASHYMVQTWIVDGS